MHTAFRPLLLAALIAALAACGGSPPAAAPAANQPAAPAVQEAAPAPTSAPAPTEAPAATATPEPTATVAPTATPEPAEPGTSRSAPLPLGTELRFEDWAVSITAVSRGDEAAQAIAGANQFNDPAPEGWQYLLASLKLTNISTEQEAKSVLFGVDLRVTGDRNILYSRASVVVPQDLDGELFPEGSAEGQIAFLVPADEGNLMFFVAESFSFDLDARRFVAIDEGASIVPDPALAAISPTEDGSRRAAPAPLGATVVSKAWEVTVLEVLRGADAAQRITEANQFNDPAPEGQEYIVARIRARYLGGDGPDTAANIDQNAFKVTGAANVIYDRPSIVAPEPALDAYLFPGGQVEGWVVVQAPAGEAGLTLVYEPIFEFGDDNVRFLGLE
jgi:predicted small lipoprotein YifL